MNLIRVSAESAHIDRWGVIRGNEQVMRGKYLKVKRSNTKRLNQKILCFIFVSL